MKDKIQGYSHGHDYVEIGGVKWATMNVGAKSVTDVGLYFAWGETRGYKPEEVGMLKLFLLSDYKLANYNHGYFSLNKYTHEDKLIVLQPQDDPVHVAWRGGWRLPTDEEANKLWEATISEWVDNYQNSGVAGLMLTDKIDPSKRLFFPAAGYCCNDDVKQVGCFGFYWCSTMLGIGATMACCFSFDNVLTSLNDTNGRFYGFTVRGVMV